MRAVRSFDPCLPCGVHMYTGGGNVVEQLHTPRCRSSPTEVRRARARPHPEPRRPGRGPHGGTPGRRGPPAGGGAVGVVAEAMEFSFDVVTAGGPLEGATLVVERTAGDELDLSHVELLREAPCADLRLRRRRRARVAPRRARAPSPAPAPARPRARDAGPRGAPAGQERPPGRARPGLPRRTPDHGRQPDELSRVGQDLPAGAHRRRARRRPTGLRRRGGPGDVLRRGSHRARRRPRRPGQHRIGLPPRRRHGRALAARAGPGAGLAALRRERRQPGVPGSLRRGEHARVVVISVTRATTSR